MKYKKILQVLTLSLALAVVGVQTTYADPVTQVITCKDGKQVTVRRSGDHFTQADFKKACKNHGGYDASTGGGITDYSSSTDTGTNPIAGDDCGGVKTSIIKCDQNNTGNSVENNGVWGLLLIAVNILTAGVGLVAVGGIIYGAFLYASAEDKSEQVNQAKQIITNVVIGLVLFALMYALLNFLIPGGIFT